MNNEKEQLNSSEAEEVSASEKLLQFGLLSVPENIKAVLDQQKTMQHPEGFDEMIEHDVTPNELGKRMNAKNIKQVIHFEGRNLWSHVEFCMRLVDFMNIPDEEKTDLKLVLLYHDLGKTNPGLSGNSEVQQIQRKELEKGKLYKVAKGHANEKLKDIESGFKANGISGRKLDVFMMVVQNHMETSLGEMKGGKLVELFNNFGKDDDERREVAKMLANVVQIDSNAGSRFQLTNEGEPVLFLKDNRTGVDFEKIWQRYLEAKEK